MAKALESPVFTASGPVSVVMDNAAITVEFPGPALVLEASSTSTPTILQTLISVTPTAGKLWKLRRVEMVSRGYSDFTVLVGGQIKKQGKTSPTESTVSLPFEPWVPAVAPELIEMTYQQDSGPALPIIARIYYTEE